MIEILNLRKTKDGYLANGYIPLLPNDEQVFKWVKDKKEVMPMFTDVEIEAQILAEKVAEAKAYLANTDYKDLPRYVPKANEDIEAIYLLRDEAREFIRANDVLA